MQPRGEGRRADSRKLVDKIGRPWERWKQNLTSSGEEPTRSTKMERQGIDYCPGRKKGRNP